MITMPKCIHTCLIGPCVLFWGLTTPTGAEDWTQWGGPRRDFHIAGPSLATTWPEDGPVRRWQRELGEGYAGIVVVDGRVLTQFRHGDTEFLAAFDAATGEEIWRQGHEEPASAFESRFGLGPYATPAVDSERVFIVGSGGMVRAIEVKTGRLLWNYPLWKAAGATRHRAGYTNSPLFHDGLLILPVGGDGDAVVALRRDGSVAWRGGSFKNSHASPVIIPGPDGGQLVIFAAGAVLGFEPATGRQLWRTEHANPNGANVATPLWLGARRLFVSSGPEKGSRVLEIPSAESAAVVEEVWASSRFRIFHSNTLVEDGRIHGSTGGVGQAMLAAADPATGEVLWRDRRIGRANFLQVGELTLSLGENGRLWLLRLGPSGVEILAETQLFDGRSWTPPTVVDGRLYARDQQVLVAVDLPLASVTAIRPGRGGWRWI